MYADTFINVINGIVWKSVILSNKEPPDIEILKVSNFQKNSSRNILLSNILGFNILTF